MSKAESPTARTERTERNQIRDYDTAADIIEAANSDRIRQGDSIDVRFVTEDGEPEVRSAGVVGAGESRNNDRIIQCQTPDLGLDFNLTISEDGDTVTIDSYENVLPELRAYEGREPIGEVTHVVVTSEGWHSYDFE